MEKERVVVIAMLVSPASCSIFGIPRPEAAHVIVVCARRATTNDHLKFSGVQYGRKLAALSFRTQRAPCIVRGERGLLLSGKNNKKG